MAAAGRHRRRGALRSGHPWCIDTSDNGPFSKRLAADRCAFRWVASIISWSSFPPLAARAAKMRLNTQVAPPDALPSKSPGAVKRLTATREQVLLFLQMVLSWDDLLPYVAGCPFVLSGSFSNLRRTLSKHIVHRGYDVHIKHDQTMGDRQIERC